MILCTVLLFIASFSLSQGCEDIVREAPSGILYGARLALVDSTDFIGNGYFLSAHSNPRNAVSTWALAYQPGYRPEDNVWNIERFIRSGKTCFRITKSGGRNSGQVLTAHSDSRGSDVRVLVHTAGHSLDDECWNFEKVATNTYKIYKILGRNQGMNLVADVGRDATSYWADVSNSGDHVTWRVYGNLELNSHVDLRNMRLLVMKPSFNGHTYALTAHSDTRDDYSTWALTHKRGHNLEDELWNIIPFKRQGIQCYRIEKAGGRNSGKVLSAHDDARGSDRRAIVYSAGHSVDNECWNFVRNPENNNYRIFKVLGYNKNMDLVAEVGRNAESYWADVSSSRSMEWRIQNSQGEFLTEHCNTCPEGQYGNDRDNCTPCPEGTSVAEGEGINESDCTLQCDCGIIDDAFELYHTEYDIEQSGSTPLTPLEASEIWVDASGVSVAQTQTLEVSQSVTESSFFSHTAGTAVTVGMSYTTKVPFVGEYTISAELMASYDYNWGAQRDTTRTITGSSPCTAAAGTIVECQALIFRFQAVCPYVMTWQHRVLGPSCQCETSGMFTEVSATRLEFYANEQEVSSVDLIEN